MQLVGGTVQSVPAGGCMIASILKSWSHVVGSTLSLSLKLKMVKKTKTFNPSSSSCRASRFNKYHPDPKNWRTLPHPYFFLSAVVASTEEVVDRRPVADACFVHSSSLPYFLYACLKVCFGVLGKLFQLRVYFIASILNVEG